MDSLVVFVIIIAINIFAKSAQEKRKIEKAKTERAKQLRNNPIPNMTSQAQRTQSSRERTNKDRDILKTKREKEYYDRKQEYIDAKNKKQENYNSGNYNYSIEEDTTKHTRSTDSYGETINREGSRVLEVEGHELTEEQLAAQKEIKKGFGKEGLERKKLINAIIWAEILGEPKSIQNIKKGV